MNLKHKLKSFLKSDNLLFLIPIFFAVAVIPTIVRIQYYHPMLTDYSWFPQCVTAGDMFMIHKNRAMLLLDGILIICFFILHRRKLLPKPAAFVPLGIYFALILLSALFSVSPDHTWIGFYEMQESAFVLFGYCMICYYIFAVVKTGRQLKLVLYAALFGIFLLCAIGVSQFMGHNFYATDLGKALIYPAKYAFLKDQPLTRWGDGIVCASLYNPNYMGVYSCITIPLLLVLSFSISGKKKILPCLVLGAMALACLAGCGSKSAVLAITPCMIFAAFYFGRRHWKKMIPVYLLTIVLFSLFNLYAKSSLLQNTLDRLTADYKAFPEYNLTDITLNDDDFLLTYKGSELSVRYLCDHKGLWSVEAFENGHSIPLSSNPSQTLYQPQDARFDGLEFVFDMDVNDNPGFSVKSDNHSFFIFYDDEQKTYLYTNFYRNPCKIQASPTFDLPLFHMLGGFSGRGYIWSKTLPALKKTILLGSGPDTFPFLFPQYDYVSLIQNGWEGLLIMNPHCLYLQIAIQTGVLSLIAFLVFYLWYFVSSFKLYRKSPLSTLPERAGAGIFLSSICFMIAGLTNDSTIGVSIFFWSMLGLGFACNRYVAGHSNALDGDE